MEIPSKPVFATPIQPYPYSSLATARENICGSPLKDRITQISTAESAKYSEYAVDKVIHVTEKSLSAARQEILFHNRDAWVIVSFVTSSLLALQIAVIHNSNAPNISDAPFWTGIATVASCSLAAQAQRATGLTQLQDTCQVAKLRENALNQGFSYAARNELPSIGILHPQETGWLYEENLASFFAKYADNPPPSLPDEKGLWILDFFQNNPISSKSLASLDVATIAKLKYFPRESFKDLAEQTSRLQEQLRMCKEEKQVTPMQLIHFISEIQNIAQAAKNSWENRQEEALRTPPKQSSSWLKDFSKALLEEEWA